MHVILQGRLGILRDCTALFAGMGVDIIALKTQSVRGGKSEWDIEAGATSEIAFEEIKRKLLKISGVLEVEVL